MKKFFKGLLIVIVVLIAVYFILCLVGPKETMMERSITVNAPQEMVIKRLGDLKYFNDKWSPWAAMDPNSKNTFEGTPNTPGHKFSWDGNDSVGAGTMTIDSITANTVYLDLNFKRPWESQAKVWTKAEAEEKGTKVTWGFKSQNPFMARAMMVFMNMEKMLAPDYEKGLAMLKAAIESESASAPTTEYTISEIEWQEKNYVGKRSKVKFQDIATYFNTNLPAAFADAEKNKLQVAGQPVGIFWAWDDKNMETDMAAAIPVANAPKTVKGWEVFNVPAGKALSLDYYGAYEKTEGAHMAMDKYMKEKNLSQSLVIEEYVTDPGVEKDTTKWLTKIYYILK